MNKQFVLGTSAVATSSVENIGNFNGKEHLLEIFSVNNFWLLPQTEMSEHFCDICQFKGRTTF